MRPDSFRFRPPRFDLSEEVRWTLGTAFSTVRRAPESSVDPESLLQWTQKLALGERIAARYESQALVATLGPEVAETLVMGQRRAAGRSLLLIELARLVAETARRLGTPVVLLKGLALLVSEITPVGSRDVYDVDVLVPRHKAGPLSRALLAEGFDQATIHESTQHLPALIHPKMGVTEIHVLLRELRIDSPTEASFEDLDGGALLTPAPDPANALIPTPTLLAAHALAHGIAQHGRSPTSYPFFRMLADLQDIAAQTGDLTETLEKATLFVHQSVSSRELAAVFDLLQHLEEGTVPSEGDGARLVRHAVAGHVFPEYEQSLKVDAFWGAVKRRDWLKISRRIRHSLAGESGEGSRGPEEGVEKHGLLHSAFAVLKVGWAWLRRTR